MSWQVCWLGCGAARRVKCCPIHELKVLGVGQVLVALQFESISVSSQPSLDNLTRIVGYDYELEIIHAAVIEETPAVLKEDSNLHMPPT